MESAFFPWKKYLTYGLIAIAGLLAYSWVMSPLIVTVSGTGELSAKAETAALTFTLTANEDSAQDALSSVKNTSNKIKESLKTAGIAEMIFMNHNQQSFQHLQLLQGQQVFKQQPRWVLKQKIAIRN